MRHAGPESKAGSMPDQIEIGICVILLPRS